ncbi:MAG TPA: sigma-70 family RNA polymerase sigma factor [Bryobacteraceae bacterium]|nr:sigma-70 family RNA polymerase sigma factor [Bryobacteraceae bacterium]
MASSVLGLNSNEIPADAVGRLTDEDRRADEQLVERLRAGEEAAYETLLARFQQPAYNLAFRLLNDSDDASDAVQEVFLKVFRNVRHFRRQSSLKTWIYRITVNEAHNRRRWFFRHRSREVGLDHEPEESRTREVPDSARSPFDCAFDREKQVMIEAALGRINPLFREVVVLRDIEDLSYEEIAEILQISLGTVKSRIMRGREALRQELTGRLEPQAALRWAPE